MFQFRVATGHHPCHLLGTPQQGLRADRHETAAQEGSERRRVTRSDLSEHDATGRNKCERFVDQSPTCAGRLVTECFDRHLQSTDQPTTDDDEPGAVAVDVDVTPMRSRSHHSGMAIEVSPCSQSASSDAASDQDGVVRSDPAIRANEPPE